MAWLSPKAELAHEAAAKARTGARTSVGLVEVIALLGAFLGHAEAEGIATLVGAVHVEAGASHAGIGHKGLVIDSQTGCAVGKDGMVVYGCMEIGTAAAGFGSALELVLEVAGGCELVATAGRGLALDAAGAVLAFTPQVG